jgi:hypothetical protein
MANTHPKSPSKKRLLVGSSGKSNSMFEEVKIPGKKKLKVLPVGIGVVTCFPPKVMLKSHHSNKSKTLSLQWMSDVIFSIAKRVAFMGKHKVQCSPDPDPTKKDRTQLSAAGAAIKVSVVKSSTKTKPTQTTTKTKMKKKQRLTKGSAAAIST